MKKQKRVNKMPWYSINIMCTIDGWATNNSDTGN